ncbi:hypothetical protein C8F01DRAFT_1288446 [Mycena amicta]|nr:hypothetical protein C8F01DRAFT_1288446 [Mycena amicta]
MSRLVKWARTHRGPAVSLSILPSLPTELLLEILAAADDKTLHMLARVSRRFYALAKETLLLQNNIRLSSRSVSITSSEALRALRLALALRDDFSDKRSPLDKLEYLPRAPLSNCGSKNLRRLQALFTRLSSSVDRIPDILLTFSHNLIQRPVGWNMAIQTPKLLQYLCGESPIAVIVSTTAIFTLEVPTLHTWSPYTRDPYCKLELHGHHVVGGSPDPAPADSADLRPVHLSTCYASFTPRARERERERDREREPENRDELAPDLRPRPLPAVKSFAERYRVDSIPRRARTTATAPQTPEKPQRQRTRSSSLSLTPISRTVSSPGTPQSPIASRPRRSSISLGPAHLLLPSTTSAVAPPPQARRRLPAMATIPFFTGDRNVDTYTAPDFVKSCKTFFRVYSVVNDAEKIEECGNHFRDGTVANLWFQALTPPQSTVWAEFVTAFETRFKTVTAVAKPKPKARAELTAMRIDMAELAKPATVIHGRSIPPINNFIHRLQDKVNEAEAASEDVGLWEFFHALPDLIANAVNAMPANWTAMITALEGLSDTTVESAVNMYKASKATQDQIDALQRQMQTMRMSPMKPLAVPPAAPPLVPPAAPPPGPAPAVPNANTGGRRRVRQDATEAEKNALREVLARTIALRAPDTPAGHVEYEAQVARWDRLNGNISRSEVQLERTGYPLRPGTAPPCSGECFKCGKTTPYHRNAPCPTTVLPSLEQSFRAVCHTWLGKTNTAPAVNMVEVAGVPWYEADDEGEQDFQG